MGSQLDIIKDSFTERLEEMVKNSSSSSIRSYLNRVAYAQYQKAQIKRWDTQNVSETGQWARLNPQYAKAKRKRFAKYPYGGTKMMVATGALLKATVGTERRYHRKIVHPYGLEIGVTVPYAKAANAARPFMEFGDRTTKEIISGIRDFLVWGKK